MPRDISGNYTLPAGNPVVTGTTISSTWANDTLSDIATALTNSLSIDGSVTTLKIANGAVTPMKLSGFTTGNTGVLSATSDTNFVATLTPSVNGVQFPATQVPSADPNCLDDYEEGTWTPAYSASTPGNLAAVYTLQSGYYTKIGRLATIHCRVTASSMTHTTASGDIRVTGLPFTSSSSAPASPGVVDLANNYITTSLVQFSARVPPNASYVVFLSGLVTANRSAWNTIQLTAHASSEAFDNEFSVSYLV